MAVGYRSSSVSGTSDVLQSTIAVPVPAGAAAGDIALLAIKQWNAGNPTVTWPTGFTEKINAVSGDLKLKVAWKRLTGADAGNYTPTWTGGQWTMGHCILITGGITTGDPVESTNTATGSGTTVPSTTLTTATMPFLAHFVYNDGATATGLPPTSYTEVQDGDYLKTNYRIPGTTGSHTASGATVSASVSLVVALLAVMPEPAGGGATPTPAQIVTTSTAPQATPSAGSTKTPAVTVAVVAAPLAVASISDSQAPAVITAIAALPQATVTGSAVVSPAAISTTVSTPQAAPSGSVVKTPTVTVSSVAAPQATVSAGGSVTASPATTLAVVALPLAARLAGATASPAQILTTVGAPTAVPAIGALVAPGAITAVTAFPQATRLAGAAVTPGTVVVIYTMPGVTAGGPAPTGRDLTLVGVVESNHWTGSLEANRWAADIEPNRWEGTVPWPEL